MQHASRQSSTPTMQEYLNSERNALKKSCTKNVGFSMTKFFRIFVCAAVAGPMIAANSTRQAAARIIPSWELMASARTTAPITGKKLRKYSRFSSNSFQNFLPNISKKRKKPFFFGAFFAIPEPARS